MPRPTHGLLVLRTGTCDRIRGSMDFPLTNIEVGSMERGYNAPLVHAEEDCVLALCYFVFANKWLA